MEYHLMKLDKDISLPCHPQYKFKMEYTEVPFSCDGCKEAGIGLKYRCDFCDFDLHKICALAPTSVYHPFYKKYDFCFYTEPPGSVPRYCKACGKDVLGFVYHCNKCGFDLGGALKKCGEIDGGAIVVVISTLLGDPTALRREIVGGAIDVGISALLGDPTGFMLELFLQRFPLLLLQLWASFLEMHEP